MVLTEHLSGVFASASQDLLPSRVLSNEGSYIVDLAVNDCPTVQLAIVLLDLLHAEELRVIVLALQVMVVQLPWVNI